MGNYFFTKFLYYWELLNLEALLVFPRENIITSWWIGLWGKKVGFNFKVKEGPTKAVFGEVN